MTRFLSTLAVLAIALVAGIISYSHIAALALANGYSRIDAQLLPVAVDGTIVAASMVLLDYARRGVPAPALGRILLGAGIGSTILANAVSGLPHGVVGVGVAMLPALLFTGSVELLIGMVRGRAAPNSLMKRHCSPRRVTPVAVPRRMRGDLQQPPRSTRHWLPTGPPRGGCLPHRPRFSGPTWRPEWCPASARSNLAATLARRSRGHQVRAGRVPVRPSGDRSSGLGGSTMFDPYSGQQQQFQSPGVEAGPLAGLQGQIAGVLNAADSRTCTCRGRRAPCSSSRAAVSSRSPVTRRSCCGRVRWLADLAEHAAP